MPIEYTPIFDGAWIVAENPAIKKVNCLWIGTEQIVGFDRSKLHIPLLKTSEYHSVIRKLLEDALEKKIISSFKFSTKNDSKPNIEYVLYLSNDYDQKNASQVLLLCQKILAVLKETLPAETSMHQKYYTPLLPPYIFYRQTARNGRVEYIDVGHYLALELKKQALSSKWYLYLSKHLTRSELEVKASAFTSEVKAKVSAPTNQEVVSVTEELKSTIKSSPFDFFAPTSTSILPSASSGVTFKKKTLF